MKLANSLVVRETLVDPQGKPAVLTIKHDLTGFKLKDRVQIKSWEQIHTVKETAKLALTKVRGKEHVQAPANFNNYIWHKKNLLIEKAAKTGSKEQLDRAAKFSELGADHLMDIHKKIKKSNYSFQTSCIVPLIALNEYAWEGQKIPLGEGRIKQAAKIAVELAETYDKYDSFWAKEQLPDAIDALYSFLNRFSSMKGIQKEISAIKSKLGEGSPKLDEMKAEEAYNFLLQIGGDEGVENCRRYILDIRDSKIKQNAIKKCQDYWNMYWFGGTEPVVLFPREFMAALNNIELMKN